MRLSRQKDQPVIGEPGRPHFYRQPLAALGQAELAPSFGLGLLILLFATFFTALALQQHRAFLTNGLDLGNVDQALWNTAQGRFLQFSLMAPVQSRLALHVEPILLFFVPFYWLGLGGPALLLATQATVVALGAWPLYQLVLRNYQLVIGEKSAIPQGLRWIGLLVPAAYLLLPTLESAVLFDFHAVTLAPTFLLFAFLALEQKRDGQFVLFAILAMACKEDMPLVVAMMALYAGLARRRWRLAGATLGLTTLWFITAFFVIQPRFAAGGNIQMDRYLWLGETPAGIIQTLFTQPRLVFDHLWFQADLPGYLSILLFPVAFLPLFSPLTLLPFLPPLAINLLSGNPFTWRLEDFHYGAPLAPFLFISAIYGIRHLSLWLNRHASPQRELSTSPPAPSSPAALLIAFTGLLFIFSGLYHFQRGFSPLARPFAWPEITAHHRELEAVLATIPAETPLFTQSNLAPHLSQRRVIYTDFAYFTDPTFSGEPVQDIVLDITSFENFKGLHEFLYQILLDKETYGLVTAQAGVLHFRALTPNDRPVVSRPAEFEKPQIPFQFPAAFYTFAQPDTPPEYPLQLDFGELVRLHGYSLHFNRQEEVQISLDLEALQPLEGVQPVLYLLDAAGQPQGATADLPPALVWFPVEQWPVGQTVRVQFNTFPWYTRETPTYRLALGFIRGQDPWDVGSRLHPVLTQLAPWAIRLPGEGSLVELAQIEQSWSIPEGGPRGRHFAPLDPLPSPLEANFSGQLRLLDYSPPQISEAPTPTLSVTLSWQALTRPEALTRFVQLVGPDGQIYGQQDAAPDHGHYPTSLWQPGEVVVEQVVFPVPAGRPPGKYTVHFGFYRPATGDRLRLPSDEDHIEIAVPD